MKSPAALLRSLLNDISRLHTDARYLDRDILTIESRYEHEGLSFLTKTLPSFAEAILDALENGVLAKQRAFGYSRCKSIPKFLSGMTCHVFDAETGHVLADVEPGYVASLLQILLLFSKLVESPDDKKNLETEAIDKFIQYDKMVSEKVDQRVAYRIRTISRMLLQDLNIFDPSELPCRHGPGAVSDGLLTNQKWNAIWDGMKNATILSHFGYEPRSVNDNESWSYIVQGDLFHRNSSIASSIGRVVTVPKNASSLRTITVEPCVNQFVQQGLNTVLRKAILSDGVLRQCLSLSDQSKNNHLAYIGSLTGEYATLDLKAASDLLSQELVSLVFCDKPTFLESLFVSRTPSLEIRGEVHSLRKFAGMGNATTFPVQSVVFSIICIESILDQDCKMLSYRNVKHAASRIRVYGDDIIVPTEYAASVVRRLESVGLIVNRSKSFLRGYFRESCGSDYYKGILVRPGFVRARFGTGADPNALGNLVCLANLFDSRCYYEASAWLKHEVEEHLGYKLPYVRTGFISSNTDYIRTDMLEPVALGWTSKFGLYSVEKYCRNLHRPLVRAPVIIPTYREDKLDSYPGLLRFFHVPIEGRGPLSDQRSVRRFTTKVKRRWVAC